MRAALVGICCLLFASPAAAQDRVTLGSADGYTLTAYERADELCLDLVKGRSGGETCTASPPTLAEQSEVLQAEPGDRAINAPLALAVPADIAAVEAETPRAITRADTTAVEGFDVRFAFVPNVGPGQVIRLYDAAGDLVTIVRDETARRTRATTVYDRGGVRLRVARDVLARPDAADRGRWGFGACVSTSSTARSLDDCVLPDETAGAPLRVETRCAPGRTVVFGLVPRDVRRVDVRLGDGRLARAPTQSLGDFFDDVRLMTLTVDRGAAVRGAAYKDRRGRVLERRPLNVPPSGHRCETPPVSRDALPVLPRGIDRPLVVDRVGGRRIVAADGPGGDLCLGVDRLRGPACFGVLPYTEDTVLFVRRGVAYGAVPGAVATVEIGDRRVETVGAGAYDGRYAEAVRFVAVPLRRSAKLVLRNAEGERIGAGIALPLPGVRALGEVPGTPLRALRVSGLGADVCVGPRATRFGLCNDPPAVGYAAPCDGPRTLVYGFGEPARIVAGGNPLPTTRARFRGRALWYAEAPATVGVQRIRGERVALPPATEQCGYGGEVDG